MKHRCELQSIYSTLLLHIDIHVIDVSLYKCPFWPSPVKPVALPPPRSHSCWLRQHKGCPGSSGNNVSQFKIPLLEPRHESKWLISRADLYSLINLDERQKIIEFKILTNQHHQHDSLFCLGQTVLDREEESWTNWCRLRRNRNVLNDLEGEAKTNPFPFVVFVAVPCYFRFWLLSPLHFLAELRVWRAFLRQSYPPWHLTYVNQYPEIFQIPTCFYHL